MASSGVMMMSSFSLKPSLLRVEKASIARPSNSKLIVKASGGKKITTNKPYGINGGLNLQDGVDASGRKAKGKGVYQFVKKYGANVDGYTGTTGLALWAVTLVGLLAGGALLVYNTSALAQ
ncbi:hypothetical protein KY285_011067 [Solanum tuberosum]|uniref:Photosystem II 10 kDa polypeptide, chloroplastic n=1 Tax=Solanum tuberosum TaxID=4113 RepID=M0ZQL7_SOLTU|nr:hypothetical protein KY289_011612 [Solanum tuberosum]KAH0735360.1 hypothetical protein KY285_011067 [Solanum tuberosum]